MTKLSVAALGFLLVSLSAKADGDPTLSRYRVIPETDAVMRVVAGLFEVEHRQGNTFEVIVPAVEAGTLFALVPDAKLVQADISEEVRSALVSEPALAAAYRDFTAVQELLRKIA